jgi:hypothetical protein
MVCLGNICINTRHKGAKDDDDDDDNNNNNKNNNNNNQFGCGRFIAGFTFQFTHQECTPVLSLQLCDFA